MPRVKVRLSNLSKLVENGDVLQHERFTQQEFDSLIDSMCHDAGLGTWEDVDPAKIAGVDVQRIRRQHTVIASQGNPSAGTVELDFPMENFDLAYNGLTHLLGTVAGDVLSLCEARGAYPKIEDIDLPTEMLVGLPGPSFGIPGVRELIGASGRRLLAFTAKPRVGLTTAEFVALCSDVSTAGVDIVEDDERLGNQPTSRILDRVGAMTTEFKRRGLKALYSVNITGREDQIVKMAKDAVSAGAKMLKIDVPPVSFSALQAVTETLRSQQAAVPITVYPGMLYMFRSISRKVILKLIRLCGGDIVYAGTPSLGGELGRHDVVRRLSRVLENHAALKGTLGPAGMRSSLPTVSTSLHAGNVGVLYRLLGADFAYFIGGGISGWTEGPAAGAALVRKAIDSAVRREDMPAFSRRELELLEALRWDFISFERLLRRDPEIRRLPTVLI